MNLYKVIFSDFFIELRQHTQININRLDYSDPDFLNEFFQVIDDLGLYSKILTEFGRSFTLDLTSDFYFWINHKIKNNELTFTSFTEETKNTILKFFDFKSNLIYSYKSEVNPFKLSFRHPFKVLESSEFIRQELNLESNSKDLLELLSFKLSKPYRFLAIKKFEVDIVSDNGKFKVDKVKDFYWVCEFHPMDIEFIKL